MSHRVSYGVAGQNDESRGMYMDIPFDIWTKMPLGNRLRRDIGELGRRNRSILEVTPYETRHKAGRIIEVNEPAIGALPEISKRNAVYKVVKVLAGLHTALFSAEQNAGRMLGDPLIRAFLSCQPVAGANLQPAFEVAWPSLPDEITEDVASAVMTLSALRMNYLHKKDDAVVRADIDRQGTGMHLYADARLNFGVWTDPDDYRPDMADVLLAGEVGTHEQQLICMAGAIAVAHAADIA